MPDFNTLLTLPTLIMLGILCLGAGIFIGGAMLWLKRLRHSLGTAVSDALTRQITHGQKVEEALIMLQRHQKNMEAQVQALASDHARVRTELQSLQHRMEQRELNADTQTPSSRVIH
jgi:ABC-type protease/lipase transport system fused ATPase/permease subunit